MDGTQSYCADHFIRCAAAAKSLSHVRLLVTPWTLAHQAPLSMGFSRQEYCSGLPRSPPGYLGGGIEPRDRTQVTHIAGGFFTI